MKPDQVRARGKDIHAALTSDDPDAGIGAAIDLIISIATNMAILVHGDAPVPVPVPVPDSDQELLHPSRGRA